MLNLLNQRFGRLLVIGRTQTKYGSGEPSQWICSCDCGNVINVPTDRLRIGKTRSCGCLRSELTSARGSDRRTHGMTGTAEYRAWIAIKNRCGENGQINYVDRGIRVCQRWIDSFENFYNDMGPRPSDAHSIDRRNNDGHYEPSNCRWATSVEQQNNRRVNKILEIQNSKMTQAETARSISINVRTLASRLRRGMSVDEALSKPVQHKKKN
jgi:hypothetical protein